MGAGGNDEPWLPDSTPRAVDPPVTAVRSAAAPSAIRAVRDYLSARSWEDRLPLVLDVERVRPFMEARYGGKTWTVEPFEILATNEPVRSASGWTAVNVLVGGKPLVVHLRLLAGRYLVDWESSSLFNPMSPAEFRARRPTFPQRFRAWARLDYYYNHEFIFAWPCAWSISLSTPEGIRIGNGFIENYTAAGQALHDRLADGEAHAVVVEVHYLPSARSASCFLISRVVSLDGWVVADAEDRARVTASTALRRGPPDKAALRANARSARPVPHARGR